MCMHIYICSSKVECISKWHLFFFVAMDRTNCSTNGTMTGTGEWDFCLVMVIIYAAIIAFTAVVLCLVVAANAVRGTIRFVLTNILIASITACFGMALICLHDLITTISHLFSSTDVSLQILLAIMAIGGNGRSAFMAVFAVVVVVIIKCSNSAVKLKHLIISVVVVWIPCVAVGAILVVPGVVERSPFSCSRGLFFQPGNEIWIFSSLYFPLFVIIPFTLATVLPVYALCYIRSNLMCENTSSLKPMLKFALFLLLGNGLGFFGNSIAIAGSLMIKSANTGCELILVLRRLYNVMLALSLIPTPILILVYFKPVRMQMRKYVLRAYGKWYRRCLVPSKQDPMTEMMLASPAVDDDL